MGKHITCYGQDVAATLIPLSFLRDAASQRGGTFAYSPSQ